MKVCSKNDIENGKMKKFIFNNYSYIVFNVENAFFATSAECTHIGTDLSTGTIDGYTLTCPSHAAHFNIRSGQATIPADEPLETFKVTEQDGFLYVDLKYHENTNDDFFKDL